MMAPTTRNCGGVTERLRAHLWLREFIPRIIPTLTISRLRTVRSILVPHIPDLVPMQISNYGKVTVPRRALGLLRTLIPVRAQSPGRFKNEMGCYTLLPMMVSLETNCGEVTALKPEHSDSTIFTRILNSFR